jgi:hypothetical protein
MRIHKEKSLRLRAFANFAYMDVGKGREQEAEALRLLLYVC